jgi:hypothetical protein
LDVVNLSAILSRSAVVARQFAAGAPAARRWAAPCSALPPAAAAFDFAVLTFAALAGEIVYRRLALGESSDFGGLNDGLLAGTLFVLLAQLAGLYRLPTLLAPSASLPRLTLTVALAQLAVVGVLFLLKSGADHSRGATIALAGMALALTPLSRAAVARLARTAIRRGSIQGSRVVTLGDPFELDRLDNADFPYFGTEEVARVRLSGSAALGGGLLELDRARVAQAIASARDLRATEFAAVMPWGAEAALADLCSPMRASPLPLRLYPDEKVRRVLRRGRDGGAGLVGASAAGDRSLDSPRKPWTSDLPPTPLRFQQPRICHAQVSHDAGDRRWRTDRPSHAERLARDSAGSIAAPFRHRRTAAASQRVAWRDVTRRTASACDCPR